MKIAELSVSQQCTIPLVVTSAISRETKAKKPYLSLEFFDGTDTISGNYWDWTSGIVPEINTVVDVSAQVTEWQGTKQLNIKSMAVSKTHMLADFVPTSEYNISDIYKQAYSMMCDVQDVDLREIAIEALEEMQDLWLTVPGAKSVHHNFVGGTLVHSYSVTKIAEAIAKVTPGANVDLVVVGAMLHDVGKLFTYEINGITIDMTTEGRLMEHIFMGAEYINSVAERTSSKSVYDKLTLLKHIILSHHGRCEYGSPVTPQCIEAYIVHYADAIDATNEQIRVASKKGLVTDKIWALNNRPHLSHQLVKNTMQ